MRAAGAPAPAPRMAFRGFARAGRAGRGARGLWRWAPLAPCAVAGLAVTQRARGQAAQAQAPRQGLWPEIEAQMGMLRTKDGSHKLYYEVSGNPAGRPVLFLHGGPGDGSSPKHRRLFDPQAFRIVCFDQRGAGRSTCVEGDWQATNRTELLLEDIEQLRKEVKVDQWHLVVGGSWGSTLALAYAVRHADRVKAMVLYSIFLPTKASIDFTYSAQGAGLFHPEAHEAFLEQLQPEERRNPVEAYARRLCSSDPEVLLPARSAYLRWVLRLLGMEADEAFIEEVASRPEEAGPGPAIEMHYMAKCCFLDAEQMLADCRRLKLPCHILHGRNDLICPPSNAWMLKKSLPNAKLTMVPLAGHSSSLAPALKQAIIEAIDAMK